jgi:adenylosuccinate synthase
LQREARELEMIGIKPTLFIDDNCRVTTPFEMALNQSIEDSRGDNKHGSCGVGLHETILRHSVIPLTVSDLYVRSRVETALYLIRHEYQDHRLKEMGANYSVKISDYLRTASERFMESVEFLLDTYNHPHIFPLNQFEDFIFEGAQGLLLDANHKFFPHVTCSKTGLHNVSMIINDFFPTIGLDKLEVVYVTRCYLTRHGKGPLPHEVGMSEILKREVDETNVANKYQGEFRYAWLDLNLLSETIYNDCKWMKVPRTLAITCLDQMSPGNHMEGLIGYYRDNRFFYSSCGDFIIEVLSFIRLNNEHFKRGSGLSYASFGPRKENIIHAG